VETLGWDAVHPSRPACLRRVGSCETMRRSIIVPEEDVMPTAPLLDCAGRPRSPATLPGYHHARPPRNRGLRYPPDPPTVEEIIAVMRAAGEDREGSGSAA
jgi:hypothetical protein